MNKETQDKITEEVGKYVQSTPSIKAIIDELNGGASGDGPMDSDEFRLAFTFGLCFMHKYIADKMSY